MTTNKKTAKLLVKKPAHNALPLKSGAKQAKKIAAPAKKAVSKPSAKPISKSAKPAPKKAAPNKKSAPVKKTIQPVAKHAATIKLNHHTKTDTAPAKKAAAHEIKIKAPMGIKSAVKTVSKPEHVHSVDKKPETKHTESKSFPKAKDIKVPPPKPVVLPKITSTKSRKYEPEFTRSVLDQPLAEQNKPSMRYSDQELQEFRELIQRKLETAKKELGYLQGLITRKDEMGGDDTDNRYMTMEDGSLSMEREQLSQMASRQITFIDHLEKAMMRIENKTYGICRVTGKLIDKARLRAVPHATLSIEAKMGIVK